MFYKLKNIWIMVSKLDAEEETTAPSKWSDCDFEPVLCLVWHEYFIFAYFIEVPMLLFEIKKPIWKILLKGI